eukprot:gene3568-biopygen12106
MSRGTLFSGSDSEFRCETLEIDRAPDHLSTSHIENGHLLNPNLIQKRGHPSDDTLHMQCVSDYVRHPIGHISELPTEREQVVKRLLLPFTDHADETTFLIENIKYWLIHHDPGRLSCDLFSTALHTVL